MLMRFDPLRDLEQLLPSMSNRTACAPGAMDVYRHGDELVVELDLPGVERDAIDITAERNVVRVRARRPATWHEGDRVLIAERATGEFARELAVGEGLDLGRVDATYDAGVLRLRIPVAEEAKPRRVPVRLGGEAHAVETEVSPRADDTRERAAVGVGVSV